MPRLTKRFADSVQPAAKDRVYWDENLRGFGLRVQPTGAKSWVAVYRNRYSQLRKLTIGRVGTLTPAEAREAARQCLAEAHRGGDPAGDKTAARKAMRVGELCDLYLAEAEAGRIVGRDGHPIKPSTLAMDRSRIACHVRPLIGNRAIESLTTRDLERMQADIAAGKTAKVRKDKGRGGKIDGGRGVAARTLGMVSTILQWAKRSGIIETNPARGAAKLSDQERDRFLDQDEIKRLGLAIRRAADEGENRTALAALRALLLTGCRRVEILGLKRTEVDAPSRCIRFTDTKSGRQVRPIGVAAAEFLASQPVRNGSPWVFPSDRQCRAQDEGEGEGHIVGVPSILQRLCSSAGLKDVTLHVLRHTFASTAEDLGFSQLTVAGLLGHKVRGVTARYMHKPDAALVTAASVVAARLADLLDGIDDAASDATPKPNIVHLHRQAVT